MNMAEAKQKQHQSWTMVAPGWGKYDPLMRSWAAPVTERMIELASIRRGSHVLDIACGAGEPALTVAETVGPNGSVLATDFVAEMVGFASSKAKLRALSNIEFRCVDGEVLNAPVGAFDAVTMRWGLMFMPDPVACMRHVNTALKPGGKAVVCTWTEAANNPFVTVPLGVLKRHMEVPTPPEGAPGTVTSPGKFLTPSVAGDNATGVYTIAGGMRVIMYTSVLQTPVLLLGSFFILFIGLSTLGNGSLLTGWGNMITAMGDQIHLIRSLDDKSFPWLAVLPGSAPLPWQVLQTSSRANSISLSMPKTASSKESSTESCRSPPRRGIFRERWELRPKPPKPKNSSKMSEKSTVVKSGIPPVPCTPAWP